MTEREQSPSGASELPLPSELRRSLDEAIQALQNVDWGSILRALPVDQFQTLIEDRMERIAARRREIETLELDVATLEAEVKAFRQLLQARNQFLAERQREIAQVERKSPVAALPPRRKRAAVLRVFEDEAGRELSPNDVRQALARAGLIDPTNETGTPVRIILAQLTAAGTLLRAGPGRYRLPDRDERLMLAGVDGESA